MTTLSTFHLFPMLPFELRLKIWDFALSTPRVVTISCEREILDRSRRFAKSFVSQTAVPALLHTCRESRFEGLSTYTPLFKTDASPIYTYISFEYDTIRCADSVLEYIGGEEVEGIQRMILDVNDAMYFGHFHMDLLKRMGKLRELDLLTQEGETYNWNRGGRYLGSLIWDFEETRNNDPEWECPLIRILNRNTGEELSVILGGAALSERKEGYVSGPFLEFGELAGGMLSAPYA